jgi:hypothetical protein
MFELHVNHDSAGFGDKPFPNNMMLLCLETDWNNIHATVDNLLGNY